MDLILCAARDISQGEAAITALASALGSGQLDPAAFSEAVNRVTVLRAACSDICDAALASTTWSC